MEDKVSNWCVGHARVVTIAVMEVKRKYSFENGVWKFSSVLFFNVPSYT